MEKRTKSNISDLRKPAKEQVDSVNENTDLSEKQNKESALPYIPRGHSLGTHSADAYLNSLKDKVKQHHDSSLLSMFKYPEFIDLHVITAKKVGPDELIENRAAWVEFEIWNRSINALNAFVRVRVDPRQSLSGYAGTFEYRVDNLQSGQKLTAAISFVVPRADYQNKITVELCEFNDESEGEFPEIIILSSDDLIFNVAAKFDIQLTDIFVLKTASHSNDTVVVDFLGLDNSGNVWDDQKNLEDHSASAGRGGGILVRDLLPIGPFTAYYASGKYILVNISIGNIGHTSKEDDAKDALLIVSAVGAKVATGVANAVFGASPVWEALSQGADQLHQQIINYAFANCDTMVGLDSFEISDTELFDSTFDPLDSKVLGQRPYWKLDCFKRKGETVYDQTPPILGGGCEDSHYIANICVNRYRAPEVLHSYTTDGTLLMPDEIANFSQAVLGNSIVVKYDYDLGRMDALGNYLAPPLPDSKKFEIIKWRVTDSNKRGEFVAYEDFALVLLT